MTLHKNMVSIITCETVSMQSTEITHPNTFYTIILKTCTPTYNSQRISMRSYSNEDDYSGSDDDCRIAFMLQACNYSHDLSVHKNINKFIT